ncbi:hypothetical protein E2320_012680, partial [Naja naja]
QRCNSAAKEGNSKEATFKPGLKNIYICIETKATEMRITETSFTKPAQITFQTVFEIGEQVSPTTRSSNYDFNSNISLSLSLCLQILSVPNPRLGCRANPQHCGPCLSFHLQDRDPHQEGLIYRAPPSPLYKYDEQIFTKPWVRFSYFLF